MFFLARYELKMIITRHYSQSIREKIIMKIKNIVVAAATVLLLITGNAWAGSSQGNPIPSFSQGKTQAKLPACHKPKPKPKPKHKGGHHKVPEINAATGTSAIALLAGVLLLAGEGVRSRISSNKA
jgi:hypothetical protein